MNEPKRRGRPPKAKADVTPEVALVQAEMRQSVEIMATGSSDINPAQVYALRVWNGQNHELPRNERFKRVAKALEAQGLSMEGVEL
jgi:hypothetical protein